MTYLITPSTARKRYPCSWDCGSPIEPGTRYIRWSIPPGDEGNEDGDHWIVGTLHDRDPGKCPTFIHGTPHPALPDRLTEEPKP